jgi:CspA family cold shock protein
MSQGTIKLLVDARGYGFIAAAEGPDVFFAHDVVAGHGFRKLVVGQTVEYEVSNQSQKGAKGLRAKAVLPATSPSIPGEPTA